MTADDARDEPVPRRSTTDLETQDRISEEIEELAAAGARPGLADEPRLEYPPYRSTLLRHPTKDLHHADPEDVELLAPCFGTRDVHPLEADLTVQHAGEPVGERTVVTGRVLDAAGRPVAGQLVEVWQANAAGRYVHRKDQHHAPVDPNFTGTGRCLTGPDGTYRFMTVKPGPYPWRNHRNAWRPAHIHFSLFGRQFTERLVTQMYFPGDPLLPLDPIFRAVVDPRAQQRLVAAYAHDVSEHEEHTGYRWDIVLGGTAPTPLEAQP